MHHCEKKPFAGRVLCASTVLEPRRLTVKYWIEKGRHSKGEEVRDRPSIEIGSEAPGNVLKTFIQSGATTRPVWCIQAKKTIYWKGGCTNL